MVDRRKERAGCADGNRHQERVYGLLELLGETHRERRHDNRRGGVIDDIGERHRYYEHKAETDRH